MTSKLRFLVAAGIVSAAMMSASSAFAAGSLVGTDVQNTATVDYQVGGVAQTQRTATDLFDVDRKVVFTLTEATATGTTSVVPNQQDAVTRFTLTNTSNDTLDFLLTAAQLSGGTAAHGGTDNFDVTGFTFFVDVDPDGAGPLLPDGVYTAATDTATTVDNLAPDTSRTIFIVGDIPISTTNGQVAGVTMTANVRNSDGSVITAATDATVNTAGIETIFADAGRNGTETAGDDYTVAAPNLTVTKLSRVVRDNVNGPGTSADPTNPKAVPGATVEYCIRVTNGASAATATNVSVQDNLNLEPDFTYDSSFTPKYDGTVVTGSTCTPGTLDATYNAGTNTVSATLSNIAAGETRTLVFRVTID
jgi:hypothetical protein